MEYNELKKLVEQNSFKFFDTGNFNLNFIWVRNDMIADNHFTDDLHVGYRENGIGKVLTIKVTTLPGHRGSLFNPTTVSGITGTAVIQSPKQFQSAWEFIDSYDDFSKYPFFRQIKPIDYWRDGDKDVEIDHVNSQFNKIFGTHWHKMSNVGDKRKIEQFEVNNWSLGCMGSVVSEWDKVIELTRKAIKSGQKNIFTGTILNK